MGSTRRDFLGLAGIAAIAAALPGVPGPAQAQSSSLAEQAVAKALAGDFDGAGVLAKQSGDPTAVKLVELYYLRDHGSEAGFSRIMAFVDASPNWPLRETLAKRAEKALFDNHESAGIIVTYFAARAPLTAWGKLALARAAIANGDTVKGKTWLTQAWNDTDLEQTNELAVLAEFGKFLTPEDHKHRLAALIYAQDGAGAMRFAKSHLGDNETAMARVADALIRCSSGADRQAAALPAGVRSSMPLRYALARFYRRGEQFDKARAVLLAVPGDAASMIDAEAWFEERRIIVRRSVGAKQREHWADAYQIASRHGLQHGDMATDAVFLCGWVALRYLNAPKTALPHFLKLQKMAANDTDTARAFYWIGRTQNALGNITQAHAAFTTASVHLTNYYGQLAREEIGLGKKPQQISALNSTDAAKQAVDREELVHAMRLVAGAGNKNLIGMFMMPLVSRFENIDQLNAAADVVQSIGGTAWALRFANAAALRGKQLAAWAYPLYGLPNWSQIGKPVEKPLVFALSRQESEFDAQAGSSVGAQGLMQMMPGTARLVAHQYGIGFTAAKLKDASYNVKLGSAHLADLVANYDGSYILTLVAYNAGPRRSTEWLAYYGDPRGGQVDPVDWVECIPFNETRHYVQKVMQNLNVYRSRLAPETVRPMTVDLRRGAPIDVAVASTTRIASPHDCVSTAADIARLATCN